MEWELLSMMAFPNFKYITAGEIVVDPTDYRKDIEHIIIIEWKLEWIIRPSRTSYHFPNIHYPIHRDNLFSPTYIRRTAQAQQIITWTPRTERGT